MLLYQVTYGERYEYNTYANNIQETVTNTIYYAKKAIFIDWIIYMRWGRSGAIDTSEQGILELARAWCKITDPQIGDYMHMSLQQIINSLVFEVPIPTILEITCEGCQYNLLTLYDHMGGGGCLEYVDEDLLAQLND